MARGIMYVEADKMSTRCQIQFKKIDKWTNSEGEKRKKENKVLVYKHSDGYPDGVIPHLRDFHKWYGRTDFENYTASFLYYLRRYKEERMKESDCFDMVSGDNPLDNPLGSNEALGLGIGLCGDGELHGDIVFLYNVDLDAGKIEVYGGDGWINSAEVYGSASEYIAGNEPKRVVDLVASED